MFKSHSNAYSEAHVALQKSQAVLITAPLGHGAGLFARALAKAKLCETRDQATNAIACGNCPSCHWFELGHHPDFRRLGLDTGDGSDEADEAGEPPESKESESTKKAAKKPTQITLPALVALGDFFNVGAHRGQGRYVIIEPIEALNVFAANRLLKTLEEPSPGLTFLLVAESSKGILPTIRSRCQVIALPAVSEPEAQQWVADQLKLADGEQSSTASAAQIAVWVKQAGGAPLLAVQLADPEQSAIHRLVLEGIAALPETDLVDTAQALQVAEPKVVFSVLQRWLEDLARVCAGASPRYFGEHQQRLKLLAKRTQLQKIAIANEALKHERRLANHPLNWRLFCEQTLAIYVRSYRSDSVEKVPR